MGGPCFSFCSIIFSERYGDAEAKTWFWEVWNEPDIGYWKGTREEYFKLYDFAAEAVMRALPRRGSGGPDTTGPRQRSCCGFLETVLGTLRSPDELCDRQRRARRSISSVFIPRERRCLRTAMFGWESVITSRPLIAVQHCGFVSRMAETPIIFGESDPEGCAACSAQQHPENLYRNGPLYGAYTAAVLNNILALAGQEQVNFQGVVTWAFEFEDQPLLCRLSRLGNERGRQGRLECLSYVRTSGQ